MLLRVRSRGGVCRVRAEPSESLSALLHKVSAEVSVPVEQLVLSRDPQGKQLITAADPDRATLENFRFEHGDMIHVQNSDVREIVDEKAQAVVRANSAARAKFSELLKEDEKRLRIKHQDEPHVSGVAVDMEAANEFQQFTKKRVGLLYGGVEESGIVRVDFIYEPEQEFIEGKTVVVDAESRPTVDKIASSFGLSWVGVVFCHDAREETFLPDEIALCSSLHMQSENENFVCVKVFPNEEGQIAMEGFQLSDQCKELASQEAFVDSELRDRVKTKTTVYVEQKETDEVPVEFLLMTLPIHPYTSPLHTRFVVENRPGIDPATEFRSFLVATNAEPFAAVLADFHFLFMLSKFFDVDSDIPAMVKTAMEGDAEAADNFKSLARLYAGLDG